MALCDVKEYYIKVLRQYLEVKNDLAEFEDGLKNGYITEDQLALAKEDVNNLKNNVDRLSYIMYLFEIPKRKNKKIKYKEKNEDLLEYFNKISADEKSVIDENISLMTRIRDELKSING